MKNGDLAVLGVKLMGIYALIQGGRFAGQAAYLFSPEIHRNTITVLALTLPVVAPLLLGALLLRNARPLGLLFAPADAPGGNIDSEGLQAMILATVGMLIILTSLPKLTTIGSLFALSTAGTPQIGLAAERIWIQGAGVIFEVVIGAILFTKAGDLSSMWHRMRQTQYER